MTYKAVILYAACQTIAAEVFALVDVLVCRMYMSVHLFQELVLSVDVLIRLILIFLKLEGKNVATANDIFIYKQLLLLSFGACNKQNSKNPK